jgi:glutamate/tyrosine decarboxylase-like PLP-dependent enzyme
MIADDIRLSQAMADAVQSSDSLELVTQDLSITTFRYVPPDLRPNVGDETVERHLDALNRTLLDRLQRRGDGFVSKCRCRWPIRAARLHREFPHDSNGRGTAAGNRCMAG